FVTFGGGLALMAGLALLGTASGSWSLAAIGASELDLREHDLYLPLLLCLLLAAVTKSAQFPFHFWLPNAMAAPTPVSAYLHAAAMVKAGIYLIAVLAPAFAGVPGWRATLLTLGVATMLLGGWRALRQFDIKLLLAYGTVSQLGFLMVVVGIGTRAAALAGLGLLLAHALFKATLFLVVGIVDRQCGTRDLRRLTGVARRMPVVATAAILAGAS